jgi:hypothetical protein
MITIEDIGKKAVVISGPHKLDRVSKALSSFPKDGSTVIVMELGKARHPILECEVAHNKTFVIRDEAGFEWYIAADNLEVMK